MGFVLGGFVLEGFCPYTATEIKGIGHMNGPMSDCENVILEREQKQTDTATLQ